MSEERIIGEAALHAYFDGELEDEARQDVEQWIKEHPEEQARLKDWQTQRAELKTIFDPVLKERIPRLIKSPLRRAGRMAGAKRRVEWLRAIAASVLFVLGGGVGWGLAQLDTGRRDTWPSFAAHAVGAHLVFTADKGRPVEVPGRKRKALLNWVSTRLGKSIDVPDLTKAGFTLLGGRIVPADDRPAAQFMYQNRDGKRITLFLGWNPWKRDVAYRYWSKGSLGCYFWFDGPLGFALSGTIAKERLLDMSKSVYDHFEKLNL